MRGRILWMITALMFVGACRSEVSQPVLQRPLEALPHGACMVLVASDLANTWERAEAHNAVGVLRQAFPNSQVLESPALNRFHQALQDFEQRTGTEVHKDLVLNLLGERVAVGLYPAVQAGREAEVLMVSELQDPDRFWKAFEDLRQEAIENVRFEEIVIDGHDAIHVEESDGLDFVMMQKERMLVMATTESLARRSWKVQETGSEDSAIQEPAFVEALQALGMHSVVMISLGADEQQIPWTAQGFTWDRSGMHYKRLVRATSSAEPTMYEDSPLLRDELLASVPLGMTMAYYARPTDTSLFSDLFANTRTCSQGRSSALPDALPELQLAAAGQRPQWSFAVSGPEGLQLQPAAAPLGLSQLPFNLEKDVLPWSGDEMVVVLAELVSTPLVPMPSAGLIIEVSDPETAARTLRDLERPFSRLPLGATTEGFLDVSYGGKTYRSFAQSLLEAVSPSYLIDDDVAVITTTRALMQSIIDTRRVGRHHLLTDAAFKPFVEFVPNGASAVVFSDQRRLQRMLEQIAEVPKLWGQEYVKGVEFLDGMSVLFEHFPSSVLYLERSPTVLTMNGWMLENP